MPATHGAWEGPWDYNPQVCPNGSCANNPISGYSDYEFAHSTMIVTGPHRGKVLIWNWDVQPGAMLPNGATTKAWLFDPDNPATLLNVTTSLSDDIFCSGHCIQDDGKIFIAGGLQLSQAMNAPQAIYLYDPLKSISAATPPGPWDNPSLNMQDARYYPSAIPLLSVHGNDIVVFGGTSTISTGLGWPNWERWNGTSLSFASPADLPLFEWYPRAYVLSTEQVFVFGDISNNTANQFQATNPASHPGNAWLGTLPASGWAGATFRSATHPVTTLAAPPPVPAPNNGPPGPNQNTYFDRSYAPAVLMHRSVANGGFDRLLVFGGKEGSDEHKLPPLSNLDFRYPFYRAQIHRDVMEFQISATHSSGSPGVWHSKTPMLERRHLSNAVILPTGDIFLHGGQWQDSTQNVAPLGGTSLATIPINGFLHLFPHFDQPVILPELYSPGNGANMPGTTQYLSPPNAGLNSTDHNGVTQPRPSGPNGFVYTPRGYHSFAMLLPDGRVLVGGGQDFQPTLPVLPGNLQLTQVLNPAMQDAGNLQQWFAFASQTCEIYSPPYLFLGAEPKFEDSPDSVMFSDQFRVDVALPDIGSMSFVLIKPGAVTHHFAPDQRYIELDVDGFETIASTGINRYVLRAPGANLGPAGFYMLFAIFDNGVVRIPSKAVFLRLI